MKLKLTKIGKLVFVLLLLIIIFGLLFIYYKKDDIKSIHKIESNEFYDIKIDYEETGIEKIDKSIVEYVNDKKKEFIDIVDISGRVETSKYNLIVNVQNKEYNNLISVQATSFAYTGGAHYTREDKSFIYNTKINNYITFLDLLIDEDFDKIKPIILESLYNYAKDKKIILNEDWVNNGTKYSLENYELFYFNKEGLNIVFVPYQVASWADGEIIINIPYDKLKGIIKDEYLEGKLSTDIDLLPEQKPRDLEKYKDKLLIAFTFDDGPNKKTTTRLLEGIKEYDARVTFFVLGSRVENNKDVLIKAYTEGNQIGSHTYNHLNLLLLDDATVLSEINKTNEVIEKVIGKRPDLLRPPYGNINDNIKSLANMHIINWNIDTEDWKLKNREKIKENILKYARDGAIILLHDIYTESVEGALLAMAELEKEGYAFVTIEEMIKLKGIDLDYSKTYYNF